MGKRRLGRSQPEPCGSSLGTLKLKKADHMLKVMPMMTLASSFCLPLQSLESCFSTVLPRRPNGSVNPAVAPIKYAASLDRPDKHRQPLAKVIAYHLG